MVEPTNFHFNDEAYASNSFQQKPTKQEASDVQIKAKQEFNDFVTVLKNYGVDVTIMRDEPNSNTPDSVFPNNWISMHSSGELFIYPLAIHNRRLERRMDIINTLVNKFNFEVKDLSHHENTEPPQFLEGTGSMVFDHNYKIVYAAISSRTNLNLLQDFSKLIGYNTIPFNAYDKVGAPIYHTNVMMCVGSTFALIGNKTVEKTDYPKIRDSLLACNKEIIELSNEQIYNHFAGNMLQLKNKTGETLLVMSQAARDCLAKTQIERIKKHNDHIIPVGINTIEKIGGGSARCMIAEIFT
jgi:hypothetical protein